MAEIMRVVGKNDSDLITKVGPYSVENVKFHGLCLVRGNRILVAKIDGVDLAIKIAALLFAKEVS